MTWLISHVLWKSTVTDRQKCLKSACVLLESGQQCRHLFSLQHYIVPYITCVSLSYMKNSQKKKNDQMRN